VRQKHGSAIISDVLESSTFGCAFAVLLLCPGLGVDGFSASGVAAVEVEAQPMGGCGSELTNTEETLRVIQGTWTSVMILDLKL